MAWVDHHEPGRASAATAAANPSATAQIAPTKARAWASRRDASTHTLSSAATLQQSSPERSARSSRAQPGGQPSSGTVSTAISSRLPAWASISSAYIAAAALRRVTTTSAAHTHSTTAIAASAQNALPSPDSARAATVRVCARPSSRTRLSRGCWSNRASSSWRPIRWARSSSATIQRAECGSSDGSTSTGAPSPARIERRTRAATGWAEGSAATTTASVPSARVREVTGSVGQRASAATAAPATIATSTSNWRWRRNAGSRHRGSTASAESSQAESSFESDIGVGALSVTGGARTVPPRRRLHQPLLGREHGGLGPARNVELLVDGLDVVVDGEPLDAHQARDLLDREALAQVGQDLALARRQPLLLGRLLERDRPARRGELLRRREARIRRRRAVARAAAEMRQQPARDRRRQRRLAADDFLQLLDQHFEPVFIEQVAVGAALQRREQVVVVGVQRRDHLGRRVARQLLEQLDPVAVGQFEVDQDELERVGARRSERAQGRGVARPGPRRGRGTRGRPFVPCERAAARRDLATRRFEVAGLGDRDRVAEALANDPAQEAPGDRVRSEEHTSELQSPLNLVCRLLLEK